MFISATKNSFSPKLMPLARFVSDRQKLIVKIMLLAFFFELAGSLFLLNSWFLSDNSRYASAATALAASNHRQLQVGQQTARFVESLKEKGFNPAPVQEIRKEIFSVEGVVITLSNDNMQVYEYPDSSGAQKDAEAFQKRHAKRSAKNKWRDSTHLYMKDELLIYYLGTKKEILHTLDKSAIQVNLKD